MKLNNKGEEICNKWQKIYEEENNRLGGNSENGDFIEGWCIIENDRFVNTEQDIVELTLYGYQDYATDHVQEVMEYSDDTENDEYWVISYKEIIERLKQYLEE